MVRAAGSSGKFTQICVEQAMAEAEILFYYMLYLLIYFFMDSHFFC